MKASQARELTKAFYNRHYKVIERSARNGDVSVILGLASNSQVKDLELAGYEVTEVDGGNEKRKEYIVKWYPPKLTEQNEE